MSAVKIRFVPKKGVRGGSKENSPTELMLTTIPTIQTTTANLSNYPTDKFNENFDELNCETFPKSADVCENELEPTNHFRLPIFESAETPCVVIKEGAGSVAGPFNLSSCVGEEGKDSAGEIVDIPKTVIPDLKSTKPNSFCGHSYRESIVQLENSVNNSTDGPFHDLRSLPKCAHTVEDAFGPRTENGHSDSRILIATCLTGEFNGITPIIQVKASNLCSEGLGMSQGRAIFCMLDTGAARSIVSRATANILGLKETGEGWIKVRTVNNSELTPQRMTELGLSKLHPSCEGEERTISVRTMVVDTMPITALMANPELCCVNVDLIIGQDNCWSILKREPHQVLECGLVELSTIFGKVYCGKYPKPLHSDLVHSFLGASLEEFSEEDFWALEKIGIEGDMESNALTRQNEAVRAEFERTVKIMDGDIFVRFPWKEGSPVIADNYSLAKRRLFNQLKLMEDKAEVLNAYNLEFVKQIDRGVLEVAPKRQTGRIKYYIPHHGVVKPDSATTKLRIVLDASSHMKGELSLNDILHPGPQLVPGLIGILLRSRLSRYLVISDIEKAFHAVKLQESERDCTRILWLKDINKPPTPENLTIYRYTRVPFGIKSSPYLLAISILFSMRLYESPEVVKEVETSMYVDNLLTGANSSQEALAKYRRYKAAFSHINMNLREFMVNDKATMELFDPEDRMEDKSVIKLLGTWWDLEADTISVKVGLTIKGTVTKRSVLRAVAANFDPIGISIPVLIEPKAFLQSLWKSEKNYKWDTELIEEDLERWREIEFLYGPQKTISVPRIASIRENEFSEASCHVFSDASCKAFAAVAYLQQGLQIPQLYFAKNRLNPMKLKGTIPKFELLSVLCAINLVKFLRSEIQFVWKEINLFSDSMIAISWIKNGGDHKQGIFVENRVREIRNSLRTWKEEGLTVNLYHVPGEINPADLGTKGKTIDQLVTSNWYHGPKFLLKPKENWPKSIALQEVDLRRTGDEFIPETLQLALIHGENVRSLFDWNRFSSFRKLTKTAALVIKAVEKWKLFKRQRVLPTIKITSKVFIQIEKDEYRTAQNLLYRQHQLEYAPTIRKENPDFIVNSDGLMCRQDRLSASLDGEAKNPVIVVKNCHFSRLLTVHFHEQNGHGGTTHTYAAMARKVWIRHGRAMVKSVTKGCVVCKKLNGLPYRMPDFADLPKFRTGICKPFEFTGLDYFGPIKVKEDEADKQVWALIFTCLVTRNIYLQLVRSLNTTTFLNALRCFSSRRGAPSELLCDNALSFQLATKYTYLVKEDEPPSEDEEEALDVEERAKRALVDTLATRGVKWKFTVPHAPWEGGLYERLIGNVKRTLKKTSQWKTLQYCQLEMLMTEVEGFVNSRPLTYVSDELADQIIRPIDFITPGIKLNLQVLTEDEFCGNEGYRPRIPKTQAEVEQSIKRLNKYIEHLWKHFKGAYVQTLRERSSNRFRGRGTVVTPIVGEVVLIVEPNVKRGQYMLGKITELHASSDGNIRSASVKLGQQGNPVILRRPLNSLIPLEIATKPNSSQDEQ